MANFEPIPDFVADDPAQVIEIQPGQTVRSFDFELHTDCYVEGVVGPQIGNYFEGCPRYTIEVSRRVWNGEEIDVHPERVVFPPVNGTRRAGGGYCNGVRPVGQ